MQEKIWLLSSAGIGLIVLGLLVFFLVTGRFRGHKTNYKVFFYLGLVWLPVGIALKNYPLVIMGLIFLTLGLTNKNKWEDYPGWAELSSNQKKLKLTLVVILGLAVLAGLALFLWTNYQTNGKFF